jgi:hypothetical protein
METVFPEPGITPEGAPTPTTSSIQYTRGYQLADQTAMDSYIENLEGEGWECIGTLKSCLGTITFDSEPYYVYVNQYSDYDGYFIIIMVNNICAAEPSLLFNELPPVSGSITSESFNTFSSDSDAEAYITEYKKLLGYGFEEEFSQDFLKTWEMVIWHRILTAFFPMHPAQTFDLLRLYPRKGSRNPK